MGTSKKHNRITPRKVKLEALDRLHQVTDLVLSTSPHLAVFRLYFQSLNHSKLECSKDWKWIWAEHCSNTKSATTRRFSTDNDLHQKIKYLWASLLWQWNVVNRRHSLPTYPSSCNAWGWGSRSGSCDRAHCNSRCRRNTQRGHNLSSLVGSHCCRRTTEKCCQVICVAGPKSTKHENETSSYEAHNFLKITPRLKTVDDKSEMIEKEPQKFVV